MPIEDQIPKRKNNLQRIVILFLNSDVIEILITLWQLGKRIVGSKAHEGMYEVLELDVRLELHDVKGRKATLYKREKVRFLQDNIIAYQDKAWGDGDIFYAYKCSPGVSVDRYQEGYRHRVLISLRETKKRGDINEFNIKRVIRNGFTQKTESFQVDIDHIMRKLSFSIVFPHKRFPKEITLIEKNAARTISLGAANKTILPDGREQITWVTNKPRLFEGYIMRWLW